ncbi:MAG: SDR family NAD(P)-dependent oxidoreductase [Phycisphaera sp.]|nr:MAG: SDR family NAD(P)-dependent oxidoreductase [Phycisphaera sp.]
MARIDLKGKPIAITGASSGIGGATAVACAKAGMPVALAARRTDKLDALVSLIKSDGGEAIAVACDVTKPDDCARLVDETASAFGSIYGVFANAGFGEKHDLLEMPEQNLREMFEVNFFGTINTIRPAIEQMKPNKSGHVLICTSCLSALPSPGYSIYSATKSAQHHIGRALGVELENFGIEVTTVHPVRTRTEFFDTMQERQGTERSPAKKDKGQLPEFVARRVLSALRNPRPEVWMSEPARRGFLIAAHLPRFTNRLLRDRYNQS